MNTCTNCDGKCPTPEACELPVQFADDEPVPISFAIALWITGIIVLLSAVSFIAGYV